MVWIRRKDNIKILNVSLPGMNFDDLKRRRDIFEN